MPSRALLARAWKRWSRPTSSPISRPAMAKLQNDMQRRAERTMRQTWHFWNLPTGSDVKRMSEQITSLERRVRDLSKRLEDAKERSLMAETRSSVDLLCRIRRDVERNTLRARNGIKHVAGVDQAKVGQIAEGPGVATRQGACCSAIAATVGRYGPPVLLVDEPGQPVRTSSTCGPAAVSWRCCSVVASMSSCSIGVCPISSSPATRWRRTATSTSARWPTPSRRVWHRRHHRVRLLLRRRALPALRGSVTPAHRSATSR